MFILFYFRNYRIFHIYEWEQDIKKRWKFVLRLMERSLIWTKQMISVSRLSSSRTSSELEIVDSRDSVNISCWNNVLSSPQDSLYL